MIQVITYRLNKTIWDPNVVVISTIDKPRSLDEFDFNVIDLSDSKIWINNNATNQRINCIEDLKHIGIMIKNTTKSNMIIILPQDIDYLYYYYQGKYTKQVKLKNMLSEVSYVLLADIINPELYGLAYEITKTKICDNEIEASFYFNILANGKLITKSIKSDKATTIKVKENVFATALNINNTNILMDFLREVKLIQDKESVPDWIKEVNMFDDLCQLEVIQKNNEIIKASQENIDNALKVISKNNEYKSILYTTGDELVKTVFEILEEMLGCDLSEFEDKKKEDFSFKIDEIIYIGEIKGVNSNIKSQNISQLELHHQGFLDANEEAAEQNIRRILIIAHQRNKSLNEREPVDDKQIELAKKYGSLIVETVTLLKMFEKFKIDELSSNDCIDFFKDKRGILRLEEVI